MRTCSGCGGVLGRDCWSEEDCVMITRSMENDNKYEVYEQLMMQPILKTVAEIIKFRWKRKFPAPINETEIPW